MIFFSFIINQFISFFLGIGNSVYEEQVLPLFEEMNITVNTIYTERANHARDYIKENSLDDYDGLISVGGDGMFSEICHSLLLKTAQQAKLDVNDPKTHLIPPRLRIGVIPAGSTDAVAFGTTGHNDPITSALQIIVGESLLIDITTVRKLFLNIFSNTKEKLVFSRYIMNMVLYVLWLQCLLMDFLVILLNNLKTGEFLVHYVILYLV